MLARVCIEDSYLAALPEMERTAFQLQSSQELVAMSWSDNWFTFANTMKEACQMMSIWAHYLSVMCGLRLKPNSHEVVCSSTRRYHDKVVEVQGAIWKKVASMTSLGQCIW